jgi:hypothetical protein
MKSKIYFLILLCATAWIAQSCQGYYKFLESLNQAPEAEVGVQSNSITSDQSNSSWQPGMVGAQAGIIVPVASLTDFLDIRVEANLSLQGSKWDETNTKGKTNLLYVNLPVVARYQTKSGFFGEAGLQPGLLLSAKDKYEGSTDNYMDHMKRLDLGIPVGIGYEFKNRIGVGLRFIPGIGDISKDAYEKDHNLIIALRGTYKLGKK